MFKKHYGRFLLLYDDSPKVRELYKGYEIIEVERQNWISKREGAGRTILRKISALVYKKIKLSVNWN